MPIIPRSPCSPKRSLKALFIVMILGSGALALAQQAPVRLENPSYVVEFDSDHGRLIRFFDKRSKTELISEPRLASNFRLLIPLPMLEGNYVQGAEQKLTNHEQSENSLTLNWKGPLTNDKGKYDVDVTMRVVLNGSSAEFRLNLANHDNYSIDEVWYPVLGGITGIGKREDTRETINFAGSTTQTSIFRHFPSKAGGALGIPYAEVYWSYPGNVFATAKYSVPLPSDVTPV
jgi:hypothetical protein